MKSIFLFVLFFPSLLLANETTFCRASGEKFTLTVEGDQFSVAADGASPIVDTIVSSMVITGEEAQTDAELVGEEIKESTVYSLKVSPEGEYYMAVIEGKSGNTYLVDVLTMSAVGTTALCN